MTPVTDPCEGRNSPKRSLHVARDRPFIPVHVTRHIGRRMTRHSLDHGKTQAFLQEDWFPKDIE